MKIHEQLRKFQNYRLSPPCLFENHTENFSLWKSYWCSLVKFVIFLKILVAVAAVFLFRSKTNFPGYYFHTLATSGTNFYMTIVPKRIFFEKMTGADLVSVQHLRWNSL